MTATLSAPRLGDGAQRTRTEYVAVVERIFHHTADTCSLFLRLPIEQSLTFHPGQFLSFLLPVAGQILTRPYSLASDPDDGNLLEICFNLVPGGLGSRYLFDRQIGDELRFTGPWGTFLLEQSPQAECIFIADGLGIAPIRPMMKRALTTPGGALQLLYGAAHENGLLYRAELESLARESQRFRFLPLLLHPPSGWSGLRGDLLEQVRRLYVQKDGDRSRQFYICGVGNQVTMLRDMLRQAGYQRRAVQYEKW